MWDKFKEIVLDGMISFIPRNNKRLQRSNKNHQPYTAELNQLIHEKHILWKRVIATRDVTIYSKYKSP